jgi:hypothetical protein
MTYTAIPLSTNSVYTEFFQDWMLDSGATHPMTPQESHFVTFTPCCRSVAPANSKIGNNMMSKGYGNVIIDLDNGESHISHLLLENVWLVPELDHSLLFTHCLAKQGIIYYLMIECWSTCKHC